MLYSIINNSLRHKPLVLLFVLGLICFGVYSFQNIPVGAVPDITNNQVQVISTSRDLPTEEVERYLTYPVELEMGNLPGVSEIRSISKFGLSVVTIVFDDDMGTYLPRQLISEKLESISDAIPEGFGTPSMGPITTGLGEIYQYILDVKPGYEDLYDVTELRTIQDWIVKRQLSGIDGVVEVNTWGGYLKTYEVAIDPNRLKALNITLDDVYTAVSENNAVSGGGYIEKSNEAFFIRADGLLTSQDDLESIVVAVKGKTPIYIKDIGTVGYGAATRFGAITGNGEGEKVLGQVMMLKGADSKKVIEAVIERVEAIQSSLPEGVFINPFLERSELIQKTTTTIAENLTLGFLIVLFIVVFLLGDIRSGLVVASVIPLTLLFAISAMYIFGIDANLMSLGAIDFGIIIDGAVIIVEYIAYTLTKNASSFQSLNITETRLKMNTLVSEGASKMMHSAVFGQVIIIIVFIPILALSGVEGKMFKPMAMTFCFALLGAMILCFTYVPVAASLFLKPKSNQNNSISSRFIRFLKRLYTPILNGALKMKAVVIGFALALLVIAGYIFSQLGGEFVPTLDEGDFVIQPVLKTGMSLSETVDMTTRIEKIVKKYPEVKQVVSRIGAAEVPTDPMSMEESDVIITLNPKSQWTSATSKDELADVFKEALIAEIPGVEIEFTQPIEMRFNELVSGTRADLAIKLFGEDLNLLYDKAQEIEQLISNVDGAADISVEKTEGLPQMAVKYDRAKMAKHGINISKLNKVISMGFAGKSAGVIYEGESKFDIVIKYAKQYRSDINHLKNALVDLPSGNQLPLSEFAHISYSTGPAKISRDNTRRRVVIGVNVRGRDLQSVVNEVRTLIGQNISIPTGYYVQYGGQFEYLQQATQRLFLAVPVALFLIFILLYFAFGTLKNALLIYSAIPLAAIGGVLALYLRGMPFSISAGIGFIALFGIAVLNGIVMIEHFKELKSKNMTSINSLIVEGAVDRLRPVLLTAFAAALGFLPMAISTSAGAEVQRPLATVVIGGLISATLLTLVVLPVLYGFFNKRNFTVPMTSSSVFLIIGIMISMPSIGNGQSKMTLQEAIDLGLLNNKQVEIANLNVDREKVLLDATKEVNKTDIYYEWDRNNATTNGGGLHVLGIGQNFKMPQVHNSKKAQQEAKIILQQKDLDVTSYELTGRINILYDRIQYLESVSDVYQELDSIYEGYQSTVNRKYALGESGILEKLTATQKRNELLLNHQEIRWNATIAYQGLQNILQIKDPPELEKSSYYQKRKGLNDPTIHSPLVEYQSSLIELTSQQKEANYAASLPEFNVSLFNGINSLNDVELYPGIQAGISLPLSKKHYKAVREADGIAKEIAQINYQKEVENISRRQSQLESRMNQLETRIQEYDNTILTTAQELEKSAVKALNGGEITYFQYFTILEDAIEARIKYLELIHQYNQTTISLDYLLN